jgi:hypothetical protein
MVLLSPSLRAAARITKKGGDPIILNSRSDFDLADYACWIQAAADHRSRPSRAMDAQIEAFLRDILLLQGRTPEVVLDEVRRHLATYEKRFRDRESNKRMKERAAQVCHSLIRTRVLDETRQRKGSSAVAHLELVLNVIGARS